MLISSLLIVCAYLLGSFSSAVVVCRLMGFPDPRTQGSGNPGATNVLRHGGKKAALITLCLDTLKGTVAVGIALLLVNSSWVLAGVTLAVFLGHLYPIFFNFRGGKGVATAFGALVILVWPAGLLALITWLTTALIFKYSSLAALLAALLTPFYVFWFSQQNEYYTMMSIIVSLFLFWRHRSNIRNLLQGQEDKIGHV
jgi:glycerol-3-phosphate acyltransferase PlsY